MVKILSEADNKRIVEAIRRAEGCTTGEIRVHIKSVGRGDILERAKKTFRFLRMHKTRRRNAVLIFIDPKSRQFAILGDAGIHALAGSNFWHNTRDSMTAHFTQGRIVEGIVAGIENAGQELRTHFPTLEKDNPNELVNEVTEG
ncbi:MAG: TPM domain-containing protein [Candidatus Omnitrophota bacterium]